ncbi:MAG: hypothetical protein OYL97_13095 [Candidatus Poribacteria bacterium]|nr:hypothetical protein [Candidatus Poribacteria bacterium]
MKHKVLEWIGGALCAAAIAVMLLTDFNGMVLLFAAFFITDKTNNFSSAHPVLKWLILLSMVLTFLMDVEIAVKMLTIRF